MMNSNALIRLENKTRNKILKISEYMYYLALVIYIVFSMFSSSMVMIYIKSKVFILIMLGILGILALREAITVLFVKRYEIREFLALGICILFWYVAEKNDTSVMLCSYLMVFGGRDMNLREVYKIIVPLMITVIIGVIWMANNGYILQYTIAEEGVYRHTFGFGYPLVLPCYILNITMMMAVIREEKVSWTEIGLVLLFGATFYRWCKADLSFGVTIMVALLLIIVKIYPTILYSDFFLWNILDRILVVIYPLFFFVSLSSSLVYDSSVEWMNSLDKITRERIRLAHDGICKYDVKLLGQRINFVGRGLGLDGESVTKGAYNYVDNVYISLLLRYGIIFSIVAIVILTVAMYYCYRKKMRIWLWMLALWALHGLFEDKVHLLFYNSLLLLIGQAIQNVEIGKLIDRIDCKNTTKDNKTEK